MPNLWDRLSYGNPMQSMRAGFDSVRAGQEAARSGYENNEWLRNREARALQRQINEDNLQTALSLGRAANAVLLGIGANRQDLYNNRNGYLRALDAISPLGNSGSRRLSTDGLKIETLDPQGNVVDIQPNLRGQAAENALLNSGGINLLQRAQMLPQQEQFEAQLNSRLALAQMEQQMKLQMLAAGLKGGGRGTGSGAEGGIPKFTPGEYNQMVAMALRLYDTEGVLPYQADGTVDYATAMNDPNLRSKVQQYEAAILRDMIKQNMKGLPPLYSGAGALGERTRRQQESEDRLAGLKRGANSSRKPSTSRGGKLSIPSLGRDYPLITPPTVNPYAVNPFAY